MPEPTVAKRKEIEDPAYWRRIHPTGRVTCHPWRSSKPKTFTQQELSELRSSLLSEGYFQTRPCISAVQLEHMLACTAAVMDHGHDPAYALLYDDFFEVLASMEQLLSGVLDASFKIVPDEPDVYFIPTANQHGGAIAHRDTLRAHDWRRADGLPSVINLWIAVTDATAVNSCIHVVPAHADPDYGTPRSDSSELFTFDAERLQAIRALPVPAGSVLGWSTELLHWGGRSSDRADLPRLSFAMYFQCGSANDVHPSAMPVPFELPFDYRLYLVEKVWRDPDGLELGNYLQR